MGENDGYNMPNTFNVDRALFNHPVVGIHKPEWFVAWLWMLSEARWKEGRISINGATITLKRGQFSHSVRFIEKKFGWASGKGYRFLARLKTEAMITTDTEAGQNVITICNYEQYQSWDGMAATATATATATAAQQQRNSSATAAQQRKNPCRTPDEYPEEPLLDISAGAEKDCAENATTDPQPAKKKHAPTAQEFDAFWQAYPRRIAKAAAIKAFGSAMKVATFSEIMDGVRRYAQTRPDPQYTPHPATWLNQQRWADEIKEEPDGKIIKRGNSAPTKTDRLNAVIADAIANPPDLSVWGRPRATNQHDRPMLSGPESIREGAGTDGCGDQDISFGSGGLPH